MTRFCLIKQCHYFKVTSSQCIFIQKNWPSLRTMTPHFFDSNSKKPDARIQPTEILMSLVWAIALLLGFLKAPQMILMFN